MIAEQFYPQSCCFVIFKEENMKLQNTHDVGIYCRLSRDDNNGNLESMSIGNQKQMLVDYVKEKGWNLRESNPLLVIMSYGLKKL